MGPKNKKLGKLKERKVKTLQALNWCIANIKDIELFQWKFKVF